MNSIKDVVRSSVKVPEFDKHMKKAGGHISRNAVEITIKMKKVRKPLMIKINKLRLRNLGNQIFLSSILLKIFPAFSFFPYCIKFFPRNLPKFDVHLTIYNFFLGLSMISGGFPSRFLDYFFYF